MFAVWLLPLKEHETSSEAMSVAVSQAELDKVFRIHSSYDGEEVFDVVGTAHGALLVVGEGAVSLAGEQWPLARDGQWDEQWRYLAGKSLVLQLDFRFVMIPALPVSGSDTSGPVPGERV